MKATIKVKVLTKGCMPKVFKQGDWIDLIAAEDVQLDAPQAGVQYQADGNKFRDVEANVHYIPLGVAMQLPKGYEAIVAPRSSSARKLGIIQSNSIGIIDESYCSDKDEWLFPTIAIKPTLIEKGTRLCQFRIQLSQKATMWQKIKWFFTSGIKLVEVESLNNKKRGGFGSTE